MTTAFGATTEKFRDLDLFRKILILFGAVVLIAVTLVSLIFWNGYRGLVDAEMSEIVRRNADLVAGNVKTTIDTASYNSKLILANGTVQTVLKNGIDPSDLYTIRELQNMTRTFMNITPHISAVYLFDVNGHYAGIDNYSYHDFSFDRVESARWYPEVLALKGFYLLRPNGGEKERMNGNQNVISLIRSIYDLDKASRLIGTIMLNLKESLFTGCFPDPGEGEELFVTIVDGDMRPIVSRGAEFLSWLDGAKGKTLLAADGTNESVSVSGRKVFFASRKIESADWYVVTAMPYAAYATPIYGIGRLYWIFLALLVALLAFAATLINRLFTVPIRELTETMKVVGGGEFRRVEIRTGNDEIGLLKDTYNAMIERIESLVERIREEEERKRVAELHALQMQIKPHFLYNTIDTARSLVLSGKTAEVNVLLRSLGQFFRNSICGEKDIVTIGEEIEAVKNYLIIQKIRYGEMFEAEYDIDESILDTPTLKLVLQPLVENAIYHGIRPLGRPGVIGIRLWGDGNFAYASVEDDGVGMTEEKLEETIMVGNAIPGEYIGLCGTIDRLKLFCGDDDPVEIRSESGRGTCVTVRLPRSGA